jgi:phosphatidylethanolamine-binding protein (PEBP) family uncharacterized protein
MTPNAPAPPGWLGLLYVLLALPANLAAEPAPAPAAASQPAFTLTSSAVKDQGDLPKEFTGDGEAATLPLDWSHAPAGTKSFALIMHHVAPDKTKCYWILYDIPPETTRLPKNAKNVGILGVNSTNGKAEYLPPHSKGPGAKTYIYTLYALSAAPRITVPADQVGRETLLAAMKDIILAQAELHTIYTRSPEPAGDHGPTDGPPPPPPPPPPRP